MAEKHDPRDDWGTPDGYIFANVLGAGHIEEVRLDSSFADIHLMKLDPERTQAMKILKTLIVSPPHHNEMMTYRDISFEKSKFGRGSVNDNVFMAYITAVFCTTTYRKYDPKSVEITETNKDELLQIFDTVREQHPLIFFDSFHDFLISKSFQSFVKAQFGKDFLIRFNACTEVPAGRPTTGFKGERPPPISLSENQTSIFKRYVCDFWASLRNAKKGEAIGDSMFVHKDSVRKVLKAVLTIFKSYARPIGYPVDTFLTSDTDLCNIFPMILKECMKDMVYAPFIKLPPREFDSFYVYGRDMPSMNFAAVVACKGQTDTLTWKFPDMIAAVANMDTEKIRFIMHTKSPDDWLHAINKIATSLRDQCAVIMLLPSNIIMNTRWRAAAFGVWARKVNLPRNGLNEKELYARGFIQCRGSLYQDICISTTWLVAKEMYQLCEQSPLFMECPLMGHISLQDQLTADNFPVEWGWSAGHLSLETLGVWDNVN